MAVLYLDGVDPSVLDCHLRDMCKQFGAAVVRTSRERDTSNDDLLRMLTRASIAGAAPHPPPKGRGRGGIATATASTSTPPTPVPSEKKPTDPSAAEAADDAPACTALTVGDLLADAANAAEPSAGEVDDEAVPATPTLPLAHAAKVKAAADEAKAVADASATNTEAPTDAADFASPVGMLAASPSFSAALQAPPAVAKKEAEEKVAEVAEAKPKDPEVEYFQSLLASLRQYHQQQHQQQQQQQFYGGNGSGVLNSAPDGSLLGAPSAASDGSHNAVEQTADANASSAAASAIAGAFAQPPAQQIIVQFATNDDMHRAHALLNGALVNGKKICCGVLCTKVGN